MVESHQHMATEKKYKHGRHKKNIRYKRGQGIWTRCSKAERSTNQTDRVQMYRKQATHKHIGICVLLLLTTTPAAHRKWMKQSGGKAFFGVRMDGFHFGCIFFVIRLGVRNEHTQKTHTHTAAAHKSAYASLLYAFALWSVFVQCVFLYLFFSCHLFSFQCAYAYIERLLYCWHFFSHLNRTGKNSHKLFYCVWNIQSSYFVKGVVHFWF